MQKENTTLDFIKDEEATFCDICWGLVNIDNSTVWTCTFKKRYVHTNCLEKIISNGKCYLCQSKLSDNKCSLSKK